MDLSIETSCLRDNNFSIGEAHNMTVQMTAADLKFCQEALNEAKLGLQDNETITMMEKFIHDNLSVWNEDIGGIS
jgi:hypothetical protein